MLKQFLIWAVAFLFIQELISFLLWDCIAYKDYYYPILTNIGFIILLVNIYFTNKICNFKKLGIFLLVLYYVLGIVAVVYKTENFITHISHFFLAMSFLLFVFSIKKINQCLKKIN